MSLLSSGDITGISFPFAVAKQGLLIAGAPVKADEMPHEHQELAVGLSLLFVHESLQVCEIAIDSLQLKSYHLNSARQVLTAFI